MIDTHDLLKTTREELVKCRNIVLQLQKDCRELTVRSRESEKETRILKKTLMELANDNNKFI